MSQRSERTFCQICRAECGMIAYLKDGKVDRVEGDPADRWSRGRLCVKGRHAPRILYAEDRLRYPLLRRQRSAELQRVSWDEAIDFIAGKMEAIKECYGPQAFVWYHGTTAKVLDLMVLRRLARLYGTPNITGTWSVCVGPKVVAYANTFGRPPMPWCDLRNANYIILWGTNPSVTHIHRFLGVSADIMAARKRGAKLVVVDPRRTPLAAKADTYVQIRPGTDLALALSMIHHIATHNFQDETFVAAHTVGFEELSEHVTPYTPRWAAGITDVPAQVIEKVATEFALTKPASLDRRQGVLHSSKATQTLRAMAILLAITGNVDVRGGLMLTPYRRLKSLAVPEDLPALAEPFWKQRYPLARDASGYLPEALLSENPYPLRGLMVIEGNPLSCFPNTAKVKRALAKLDLLAVQDLFMNDTTEMADVVLPGCTFLEKGEISVQSLRRDYPVRTRLPVIEPLHESLPEWKFLSLLGRKLGFDEFFPFASDQELLHAALKAADWRADASAEPTTPGRVLAEGFTTPSGKIELYSRLLQERGYEPLPVAPLDWPENESFPHCLITGARVPHFYHSQHRTIPALLKAHPEPVAEISPALACEIGVVDGEEVRIQTEVGVAVFKSRLVDGIHSRTVSIAHGWPGPHNANWLVDDLSCDPLSGAPPYRDIRCRVTKA